MVALPAVRNHPQTAPVCDCAIGRSHRGACVLVAGCASKSNAWRPCWAGTPALAQLAQSHAARPSTISSSPSSWPMPWGRRCEAGEQMDRVADGAPGCAGVRLQIPPLFKRRCRRTFMASPRLYSHAAGAGAADADAANVAHSLARKVSGQGLRAAQRFTGNEQRMQAHPSSMALVQVSIGPARAGQGLISTRRYGAPWRQQAGRHRPVDPAR